jgi:hypothetical protein
MLFGATRRFAGFDEAAFGVFAIPDRKERRQAIVRSFHPPLAALGEDLLDRLKPAAPLHAHLPRLDWPPWYEPFCTWLALSRRAHGYQAGPSLNVGVHRDHVAVRLGWDTGADGFGRFEFLARYGGLGETAQELARRHGLLFRVYAAEDWPVGSRLVYESPSDWRGAFAAARRSGVWFELGVRYDLPQALPLVSAPRFGEEAERVLGALLPLLDRYHDGPERAR